MTVPVRVCNLDPPLTNYMILGKKFSLSNPPSSLAKWAVVKIKEEDFRKRIRYTVGANYSLFLLLPKQ